MTDLDIGGNLDQYLGDRVSTARYSSFDYCFNYFQSHREDRKLSELVEDDNIQLSCLQLGFYLASWGMLRGSAELLQRSVRTFVPVIEAISSAPDEMWDIDAHNYSDENIDLILSFARILRTVLHDGASDILVTKVMLGVFGCVPAFDTNFRKGFEVTTFGRRSLQKIGRFYEENQVIVEERRVPTLDFDTEGPTDRLYTRAKVIDMIFFIQGA